MLNKLAQSVVLAGGLTIAAIAPATAQLVVTGGNINFQGTQIFVPNAVNNSAEVYGGSAAVLVRTPNISINDNVLLRGQILPRLNIPAGAVPQVGVTGTWLPTLTFVAFSNTGEPTLFRNIPAELNFRVDSLTPTFSAEPINRFASFPFLLVQGGNAANASSFGGVVRTTPVVLVEFGQFPSLQLAFGGISSVTPGVNYPGNIGATITGGTVSAPLANSFSATPPTGTGTANNGNNGSFTVTTSTVVGAFNSVTSIISVYGPTSTGNDKTPPPDTTPDGKPGDGKPGDDNKNDGDDDEDTIFVDQGNGIRYVVVGLPSRVFPGMIGIEGLKQSQPTAQAIPTNQATTNNPQDTSQPVSQSASQSVSLTNPTAGNLDVTP